MANITSQMVKELREMTQAGMMDCKKALVEAEGEMEKAIEWLREKGLAAAAKKAGRIAAELLSAQLSPGDAVLLCAGDAHTPSHYRMAAGFEAYLRENSVPLTLVRADGYHDKQELALRLRRTLAEDARISGAFSVSARLSVLLADAVAQMGRAGQVRVVASDLFGETVRNMEEGLVQNILYKDPAQQGYLAARLMGDFVLRGIQPPAGVHYVESRVIFKSSLAYYRASGAVCP